MACPIVLAVIALPKSRAPTTTARPIPPISAAMHLKLRTLQSAQQDSVRSTTLPDGRVRYYGAETASRTLGPTRGGANVYEHNPKTGQVRHWYECYDQSGKVNRIHPKMIDGHRVIAQHHPPTKIELESFSKKL